MTASKEHPSPIKFPCDFIIKIMGEADAGFEEKIMRIVKRHCSTIRDEQTQKRHSKGGTYMAITVTVYAESKEQLDSLYLELSECPDVLMAL